ncbi:hypothetical protein HanIR_Chr06g0261801 [Helianthus annuus]|nr:hypothetical protein HanIR_Chr06g0261801 [Helianthus annuus]
MIDIGPCHECKSWCFLFLFLLCFYLISTHCFLLFNTPTYSHAFILLFHFIYVSTTQGDWYYLLKKTNNDHL